MKSSMKKVMLMALCLSACGEKQQGQSQNSEILAQVGDVVITAEMFDVTLKAKGLLEAGAQQKQAAFDSMVGEAAMAHQAIKNEVTMNSEQLATLQYQQLKYQAQNALAEYLKKNPVSDAEISAEYDAVIKATKGVQFHVQHLLYQDEVDALAVLDSISSGQQTFEQNMVGYLSERPRMKNVGDIGWVNLQQMPEAFHAPLESMASGAVYPEVVLSQFGAHVLFLKDKKASEPPSLDVARAGIKKTLVKRLISKYEQLAVAKAKVKLFKK